LPDNSWVMEKSPKGELRAVVESQIRSAFRGVVLGAGVSLGQAEVCDRYGEGTTLEEYRALPLLENTTDWESLPMSELERDNVAHLDPEGYRYYIPAFALSVLDDYDSSSLRVIGTMLSLCPSEDRVESRLYQRSLLNVEQNKALASYLVALPQLLDLDRADTRAISYSLAHDWAQYL